MEQYCTSSQVVAWQGACTVDGESGAFGHDCRIVDVLVRGVHVSLRHEDPDDLLGRTMTVRFPAEAVGLKVEMAGEVKSVVFGEREATIGIQFSDLLRAEQALAIVLDALVKTKLPSDGSETDPTLEQDHSGVPARARSLLTRIRPS